MLVRQALTTEPSILPCWSSLCWLACWSVNPRPAFGTKVLCFFLFGVLGTLPTQVTYFSAVLYPGLLEEHHDSISIVGYWQDALAVPSDITLLGCVSKHGVSLQMTWAIQP